MTKNISPQAEILRQLVINAGGPAEFARTYSQEHADKAIDPTYVSQILNGHRAFGERSRKQMASRAGLPDDYFEIRPITTYPTSSQTACEPRQPAKPRIHALIEKLQQLDENHPAVQAVEWALRDTPAKTSEALAGKEAQTANLQQERMDETKMKRLIGGIGKNGANLKLRKNNG
ncbi:MAG: hypothetical protein PHD19_09485 [Dechloromonas sp.]|nr:hypothetical protein [Dechloromonas sp.]